MVMKGLPLAYAKDMQDDKPPLFEAHDLLALSIAAMTGMVETSDFRVDRMRDLAAGGHSTATDFADWLVRALDMPFRDAHHLTGAAVKLAESQGCDISALDAEALRGLDPRLAEAELPDLSVEGSVASRMSYGGTAPARVREAVKRAREEMT